MSKKLIRISTAEAVANHFRNLIEKGIIEPGSPLPSERVLIEELGISRFSLREGLARLKALGIIEGHQGKGSYVCKDINPEALNDVFLPLRSNPKSKNFLNLIEARIVLERAMFTKATELRSQQELSSLEKIIVETGKCLDDEEQFALFDYRFHHEVGCIAGNQFLSAMQEMLHVNIQEFILKNVRDRKTREKAYEDHKKLFECIKNKYTTQVANVIEEHISTCRRDYESKYV